jgi:hypothetical protein
MTIFDFFQKSKKLHTFLHPRQGLLSRQNNLVKFDIVKNSVGGMVMPM